jgi:putative ABC transport system substrate-binding protein
MRRRSILTWLCATTLAPLAASVRAQGRVYRIGILGVSDAPWLTAPLFAALKVYGWSVGGNLHVETRITGGDYQRAPALAKELIEQRVDVLVTITTGNAVAARQVTSSVPIVMFGSGYPVEAGLAKSLARPGGNVTGMTALVPKVTAKRLELLKDAFPRTRQVAVLFNPDNPAAIPVLRAMEATAKSLKLELQQFVVQRSGDLDSAFAAMAKRRVDAVAFGDDPVFVANAGAIAKLAAKTRLPSVGPIELADAGGLMAYGANRLETFRRAAYFVDRILKGAKPADLPVEQATRFETVLNQKTAKALGIQFPQAVLARADRVIE